jgi:hypothetical protein
MTRVVLLVSLFLSVWCTVSTTGCNRPRSEVEIASDPDNVEAFPNERFNASIVQLLAHRDRYHGQRVQVKGFLTVEFESTAIYLSKDDAEYGLTRNGFWVDFNTDKIAPSSQQQYDWKYVLLEGRFDKDDRGHLSLWQGTIEEVDRVLIQRRERPSNEDQ